MKKTILLLGAVAILGASAARADDNSNESTAPLPHFAALRSDDVNMRTGPGTRYPIVWVYSLRGLPVEVLAQYDIWRQVRDSDGDEGWINKTELTAKRAGIVTGATRELRDGANDQAAIVAHVEAGAVGQVLSCAPQWCKIKFGSSKGYLRKSDFWGAYPTETFN